MNPRIPISISLLILILILIPAHAALFSLRAPRSTDETNAKVASYQAVWQATNTVRTNQWIVFATWPNWTNSPAIHATNITTNFVLVTVPDSVPSLSWISFQALGTNGIYSPRTTPLLYNTNTLWPLITNYVLPPATPATGFFTNN